MSDYMRFYFLIGQNYEEKELEKTLDSKVEFISKEYRLNFWFQDVDFLLSVLGKHKSKNYEIIQLSVPIVYFREGDFELPDGTKESRNPEKNLETVLEFVGELISITKPVFVVGDIDEKFHAEESDFKLPINKLRWLNVYNKEETPRLYQEISENKVERKFEQGGYNWLMLSNKPNNPRKNTEIIEKIEEEFRLE